MPLTSCRTTTGASGRLKFSWITAGIPFHSLINVFTPGGYPAPQEGENAVTPQINLCGAGLQGHLWPHKLPEFDHFRRLKALLRVYNSYKCKIWCFWHYGGSRGVAGGFFTMTFPFFSALKESGSWGVMRDFHLWEIEEACQCYLNKTKNARKTSASPRYGSWLIPRERWLSFSPKGKVRTIHYSYSCQNYQILLTGGIGLRTTLLAITASRPWRSTWGRYGSG